MSEPEEGASLASKASERLSVEVVASSLCLSVGKTYFLRDSVRASTTKTSWSQRTIHKRLLSAYHRSSLSPSPSPSFFSLFPPFHLQASSSLVESLKLLHFHSQAFYYLPSLNETFLILPSRSRLPALILCRQRSTCWSSIKTSKTCFCSALKNDEACSMWHNRAQKLELCFEMQEGR